MLLTIICSYFTQTLEFNTFPSAFFYMFYQHRQFRPFSNFKVCVNENCVKCLLKFPLNLAVFCGSFSDLTFLSASAVLLVWFNKKCSSEIRLEDVKKQAKEMGLSLLCNKDKNTFIKALASALIKEKKVVLTQSDYTKVTQDDVKTAPGNSW